jgi:predicted lipoprotein with Yx(FWY)xxD motif
MARVQDSAALLAAAAGVAALVAGCGSAKPVAHPQASPAVAATTQTTAAATTTTASKPRKAAAKKHAAHKRAAAKRHSPASSHTTTTTTTAKTTTTPTTPKPAAKPRSKPAPAKGVAVDLRSTKLGMILVGPSGRTLYLFAKDTGTSSTCYGACADVWPPLTTSGTPQAGAGVSASLLGTTKRTDGSTEVTYHGHPLYYYDGDSAPGQTTGQAINQFGALWYVLSASGAAITTRG